MTRLRLMVTAMLVMGVMGAVSAQAAFAFEEVEQAVGTKGTVEQSSTQTLEATEEAAPKTTVGVPCTKASGVTEVTEALSVVVKNELKYSGCTVGGAVATVKNGCEFLLMLIKGTEKGFADLKPAGCKITIEVKSTGCIMTIEGEQKKLEEIVYEKNNKTTHEVTVNAKVKGVAFSSATGKACGFAVNPVKGTAGFKGTSVSKGINLK